jgi:VWFA-related protein
MRRTSWIARLCLVALGAWVGQVQAQAPSGNTEGEISTRSTDGAIKVHVNLVLVRVVVRDANGKAIPNLKQEDFRLLDNGNVQRISTFTVEMAGTLGKEVATIVKAGAAGTGTESGAQTSVGGAANAVEMPHRFVALVFDDLHMNVAQAMTVHAATEKLFGALTPTDRVAIYSTSAIVQQEFTGDAETLRKTLAAVIPRPQHGEGDYECPSISYFQADLIENKHDPEALNAALAESQDNCPLTAGDIRADAIRVLQAGDQNTRESYRIIENVLRGLRSMPGQRVMVYVSPGFILGDEVMEPSWELIDQAMRAGVVVNTIDAKGLYTADQLPDIAAPAREAPGPNDVDWQGIEGTYRMQAQMQEGQVLARLAASTGGTYFHNRNDLDAAMSQALTAPSVSYMLGFSPQDLKDERFHTLKVELANGEKYQIEARNGYYPPKQSADPEEMAKQNVREALFEP